MIFDKLAISLALLTSSITLSAGLGGGVLARFPGGNGDGNSRERLHEFTFRNNDVPPQKTGNPDFQKRLETFIADLLVTGREDEDVEIDFEDSDVESGNGLDEDPLVVVPMEPEDDMEDGITWEEPTSEDLLESVNHTINVDLEDGMNYTMDADLEDGRSHTIEDEVEADDEIVEDIVEDIFSYFTNSSNSTDGLYNNSTGDFYGNSTGDFYGNNTGDFYGNSTGDFHGNSTGDFYGNSTGDFYGNSTGDFYGNSTGDFYGNNTGDFYGNTTGDFYGNTTGDFYGNTTGDFAGNNTGDFHGNITGNFVSRTRPGRRLGTFYRNGLNYVRLDDEAVDLRLNWNTDDKLIGGRDQYFINPGMIFVENDDGSIEWVRTIRYHSTGGYSNGITSFEGEPVNEGVWIYFTAILLGSERFYGDLSGGFDDNSIARWQIQTGSPLNVADDHMLSNEDSYRTWEDLCEAKPGFLAEKHVLTRKLTTGAEDPKLFILPSTMNERSKWAVTFSSYPPAHSIPGISSPEDCKWSDYSKFQMYLAPGGEQLAHEIDTPAHRLSCGSMVDHEKNWIAFEYDNELYYVQNVQPHVVVKVTGNDGSCEKVYETSSTYLEALSTRVAVRGSATAYLYSEDEYIAILHTHDEYSKEPYTSRAYTFEAFPPFRVLRVSKPLSLQSSGLAFASSLTLYENKIMVGYGVADRESRMMVMSRDYLEKQFQGDCEGAVDRLVGASGETCAEKVVALLLGEAMMPPRRAMNIIGMSHQECRGLLDHRHCEPEMVLKVSRHNKANNCNEAFSRGAAGVSCSARIKWTIRNTDKTAEEAFRVVADEFKVCRDVVSLGCKDEDLHYPSTACTPNIFNDYVRSEPTFLLSMTHADHGSLGPIIQCSGISAAQGACENKDMELCLESGKFHLLKSQPLASENQFSQSTIATIRAAAAKISRRELESSAPSKVILHIRNPLEIVFDEVLEALTGDGVILRESKIDIYQFQDIARNAENHALILRAMLEAAVRNVQEWEAMKTFVNNPAYDALMITDEELSDRLLQPAILAEISRRLGLTPDHETILDGLQAAETLYQNPHHPEDITSNDFFLESSAVHLQYICHLMEMAPRFLQTTVEQGYRKEIAMLTQYCVGFDEEWIVTAGDEIFTGFSETM